MISAIKIKRLPWFEISLTAAIMILHGYAAFSDSYNFPNRWFTRDDAYYYYKVAQNISLGLGSTFDGINPTNGYHPLWMLVCVPVFALARFDLILPLRILLLLLAGLRAVTSILLYRLLDSTLARPIAMLAALYWAFDFYVHATVYQQGLETGLAAFFLVLFLFVLHRFERDPKTGRLKKKQIALLACSVTLVSFSRLDLVFLAILFGIWIVFRDRPLRYLLPLDVMLVTLSTLGAFIFRVGLPEYYQYAEAALPALAVSLAAHLLLNYFFGLYRHAKSLSISKLIQRAALASGTATGVILIFLLGLTHFELLRGSFPRTVPLLTGILTFILVVASRMLLSLFSTEPGSKPISPVAELKANWRYWLQDGGIYFGILGGAIGAYMLWNKRTFGTATPVSGQIKRWWGSFQSRVYGGSARSPLSFFGIDSETDFNTWAPITNMVGEWNSQIEMVTIPIDYDLRYILMLSLLILGVSSILFLNRRRAARITYQLALVPLLASAVLQILTYNITGYSAPKEWYWISQLVLLTLAGSLLADVLTQPIRRNPAAYVSLWLIVLSLGASMGLKFARITANQMPYNTSSPGGQYMEAASFIEKYTEPGSLVGMTGGGNVGYFIQERTIINMDGLINSYDYFQAHKSRRGSQYLADLGMDYIFANPDFLGYQPYRGQYTDGLEIIDYYGGKAIMRFLPASAP